jgi:hypothetical protein
MVPKDSAIAQVMGVTNAVTVDAEGLAPITLVGPGAGGMATASAVVSDLADIARGVCTPPFGRPAARMTAMRKAPMQHHEGGYYIRLLARDRPGSAATIARRLAQQQISLESIVQRHATSGREARNSRGVPGEPVPVIMITYATSEDAVRKALAAVRRDRVISGGRTGDPASKRTDRRSTRYCKGKENGVDHRSAQHDAGARAVDRDRARDRARRGRAARLRGRGAKKQSDQAAVDAMRRELNKLPIDGTVVIGEGEMDEAPMLFIGEKVGTKGGSEGRHRRRSARRHDAVRQEHAGRHCNARHGRRGHAVARA